MLINELPYKFLERMKNDLHNADFKAFLSSYESESSKSLRINRLKKCGSSVPPPDLMSLFSLEKVEWCENGYYYDETSQPGKHPLHEAGAYYIQEASAMAPVFWLDLKKGLRVLDLCAAPGGKSTEIAELIGTEGLLVANEPVLSRTKILSLNIERMGIMNTLVTGEPPEKLSRVFPGFFDRILVDAPCSGEGMFRKNPEAVNEWSPENTEFCSSRQDLILKEAAKMLVPGGIMVYSTCTFNKEENEGTIRRFLDNEEDFSLIDPESIRPLPESFQRTVISTGDGELNSGVRLYPHKLRGEGHFFAVLKRKGGVAPDGREISPGIRQALSGSLIKASSGIRNLFYEFWDSVRRKGDTDPKKTPVFSELLRSGIMHAFGDQLYLSNKLMPGITGLKVLRPGLHLGTLKEKRFEPSHALALFLAPDEIERRVELTDKETALKYLKGESLPPGQLEINEDKGWCLVCFSGMSLGWGKYDGRMIKNHYPKGLRIH